VTGKDWSFMNHGGKKYTNIKATVSPPYKDADQRSVFELGVSLL
jgi:hypothetical protein